MTTTAVIKNPDTFIDLEHRLARIMSRQEASGFRLDLDAADGVQRHLHHRFEQLKEGMARKFFGIPGGLKILSVRTKPKVTTKDVRSAPSLSSTPPVGCISLLHSSGWVWCLTSSPTLVKPRSMRTSLPASSRTPTTQSMHVKQHVALPGCSSFRSGWVSCPKVPMPGSGRSKTTSASITLVCATQTGRNAHRGPNLGQVVSAPWARKLFIPHPSQVLVGVDLEGLELRVLGHYLAVYDQGSFADVVVNGDIHQQNADRVGCTRKEVKTLTYAFIYGAGDAKLGKTLYPTLPESSQRVKGKEIRQKFLDAIPGLEPLINAVKDRVRVDEQLRGLDGRPIFCSAEHAALNYLLQGAGAVISKRFVVIAYDTLCAKYEYGIDFSFCAYVHDEIQVSCRPEIADDVIQIIEDSAIEAGKFYGCRVPITAAGDKGSNWSETH